MDDDRGAPGDGTAPDEPLRRTITPRFAVLIVLIAAAVRAVFWIEVRDAGFVTAPAGEAAFYDALARALPAGAAPSAGAPSPLYALLVAALGPAATRCAQFALGAATAALVAHLAATAFIPRVGRFAGILAALHPPFFVAEAALAPAALATFLLAATLVLAQRLLVSERPGARAAALLGAAAGLAFLCRPDAIALLAAILAGGFASARFRARALPVAGGAIAAFALVAAAGAVVARDLPGGTLVSHGVPDSALGRAAGERLSLLASGREIAGGPSAAATGADSVVVRVLSPAFDWRALAPIAVVAIPLASGYASRGAGAVYLAIAAHVLFVGLGAAIPPLRAAAAPALFSLAAFSIAGFLQCLRSPKTFGRAIGMFVAAILLAYGFNAPR